MRLFPERSSTISLEQANDVDTSCFNRLVDAVFAITVASGVMLECA